jgi:hypothetical protein
MEQGHSALQRLSTIRARNHSTSATVAEGLPLYGARRLNAGNRKPKPNPRPPQSACTGLALSACRFVARSMLRLVPAVLALGAIAAGVGCGGSSSDTATTRSETGTPYVTAMATQTVEVTPSPVPTETEKPVLKKLSEATFKPTTFDELMQSFNTALENHKDLVPRTLHANWINPEAGPITEKDLNDSLNACQNGGADFTYWISGCGGTASFLYELYKVTNYSEAYHTAVDAANYFLTQFPDKKGKFDGYLKGTIKDVSPAYP